MNSLVRAPVGKFHGRPASACATERGSSAFRYPVYAETAIVPRANRTESDRVGGRRSSWPRYLIASVNGRKPPFRRVIPGGCLVSRRERGLGSSEVTVGCVHTAALQSALSTVAVRSPAPIGRVLVFLHRCSQCLRETIALPRLSFHVSYARCHSLDCSSSMPIVALRSCSVRDTREGACK